MCLVTSMCLWGSAFSVMKFLLSHMTPVTMMTARMLIGFLILIPGAILLKIKLPKREHLTLFVFMAFLEPCLYFLFESYAVLYTSATEVGILIALMPISTAFMAWFFLGEKNGKFSTVCLFICVFGGCLLTLSSSHRQEAQQPILGNLLAIGAVLCSSGYIILAKKLTSDYSVLTLLLFQLISGTVFFSFWWIIEGCLIPSLSHSVFTSLLYLGIAVTIGAYGLFTFSLSTLPATTGGAATNIIPVVAIILGVFVLNERLSIAQWLGCLIILFSLFVRELNRLIKTRFFS